MAITLQEIIDAAGVSADGSIDTHSDVDVTTVAPSISDVLTYDGSEWTPVAGATGSALDVQEEGSSIEAGTQIINFIGAGVTATAGALANEVDVTIAGGGDTPVLVSGTGSYSIISKLPDGTTDGVALGTSGAMAIGHASTADNSGIALGAGADANGLASLAIGLSTNASSSYSIAIGQGANSNNTRSVALGQSATTSADDQIRLGRTESHTFIGGEHLVLPTATTAGLPTVSVVTGSSYYNTDNDELNIYNGATWDSITGGGGAFVTAANVTSNSVGTLATDDFVFGSDSLNDDADTAHDRRFFFDKAKGAFRAGRVELAQWDNASLGLDSTAFGLNNTASSANAMAWGTGNVASGQNSTASGSSNTASGTASTVAGFNNLGAGGWNFTAGTALKNSGDASAAFGSGVTLSATADGSVGVGLGGAGFNSVDTWTVAGAGDMVIMGGQLLLDDQTATGAVAPSATLDLVGTFQYTDGNQANTKVLTSDASGNATWQEGVGRTSTAADPTTTEYPTSGNAGIHKNTTSGDVFLAYNDGGVIKKVTLA